MDPFVKLQDIAVHMDLEPAEEFRLQSPPTPTNTAMAPCGQPLTPRGLPPKKDSIGIHEAVTPDGKPMRLMKTMLTSACERNCYYCPFRAGRNYRRQTFKPEEMARTFNDMVRAGAVDGLFLSSGIIKGGVVTQDKLLDTVDILRNKFKFRGYLHLKIMPGAEKDQVRRAMQLADRLSVNLEAPNDRRLLDLAPKKEFMKELLRPLRWIEEIRHREPRHLGWGGRWPSSVTQFVVGGVGESDLELLTTTEFLHKHLQLRRVYFSAFSPVMDTPLENQPAENPLRQHRLYQTAFLFRDYGFGLEELAFNQSGNLPLEMDPKMAWARANLQDNPVEINRAAKEELLRVPGIGPRHAQTITTARHKGTLKELQDLKKIGVATKRLQPFILLNGKRPSFQLSLFDESAT